MYIYIHIFNVVYHITCSMTTAATFQKTTFHHVTWIRAVQDDDRIKDFHSYVRNLVHGCVVIFLLHVFFWMFMIVLLIGILRECSVFILQIVPTCFASSWERLLGHVCHTTDKQANPVPNIYIYMLIHVYWIHLNDLNVDLWNLKIYLYECMHTQIRYINVHICTHTHLHKCI
jgi:hypothetical protein